MKYWDFKAVNADINQSLGQTWWFKSILFLYGTCILIVKFKEIQWLHFFNPLITLKCQRMICLNQIHLLVATNGLVIVYKRETSCSVVGILHFILGWSDGKSVIPSLLVFQVLWHAWCTRPLLQYAWQHCLTMSLNAACYIMFCLLLTIPLSAEVTSKKKQTST